MFLNKKFNFSQNEMSYSSWFNYFFIPTCYFVLRLVKEVARIEI